MSTKRDLFLGPLRWANGMIPETKTKNKMRAGLLGIRNALPRELMIQSGDTVVQVGMWRERNVHRLSKCVGPKGRVVLIEADRDVVKRLKDYAANNRLENVVFVNKGAWSGPNRFRLNVGASAAHNRLEPADVQMLGEQNADVFVEERSIEVDSVDNILASLGVDHADYVEISVNGAERHVIEGMEKTLARTKRLFVAGYARLDNGTKSTNVMVQSQLQAKGFRTRITCQTDPTQADFDVVAARKWGQQDGHVFAWTDKAG